MSTPLRTTKAIEHVSTHVDESMGGNTSKFFRYVKKGQIANSMVNDSYAVVLRGETLPMKESVKPGSPVCPDYERTYKPLCRK